MCLLNIDYEPYSVLDVGSNGKQTGSPPSLVSLTLFKINIQIDEKAQVWEGPWKRGAWICGRPCRVFGQTQRPDHANPRLVLSLCLRAMSVLLMGLPRVWFSQLCFNSLCAYELKTQVNSMACYWQMLECRRYHAIICYWARLGETGIKMSF